MTLFYLNDNPKYRWGYREFEEDVELAADVGIIAEQQAGETREEFFNRVGCMPEPTQYGFNEDLDKYLMTEVQIGDKDSLGYALDKLPYSRNVTTRMYAAAQGAGVEFLVYDEEFKVRVAVMNYGYGLDILAHDKDMAIRQFMVDEGKKLDIFLFDSNCQIRASVARQGHRLDILVNDESDLVRAEVAKHGYRLDILLYDKSQLVRTLAEEYVIKNLGGKI